MRWPLPLIVVMAACVTVGRAVLDSSFQANPIDRDDVCVFAEGDSIPQHIHVALLDAQGDALFTGESDLSNKLREEAGKLGANAIIWGVTDSPGAVEYIFGNSAQEQRRSSALAIYVPSLNCGRDEGR